MTELIRTDNNGYVVTYTEEFQTKAKVFDNGDDAAGFFQMQMEKEAIEFKRQKVELRKEKLQDEYLEDMREEVCANDERDFDGEEFGPPGSEEYGGYR